jgi:hypothetical protein
MVNDLKIVLYAVAVLSSGTCALLLFRGYLRQRLRLLMWSGICFICLTINNVALFVDLIVFPEIDLRLARLIPALTGMTLLLYGFIWDSD